MPIPDPVPTPGEVRFVTTNPNVPDVAVFDPRHTHYAGDLDEAVALPVDRYPWRTMRGRTAMGNIWMPDDAEGVDWHRLRPLSDGEDLDDMVVPGRMPDGTGSVVRIDPTRTHVALYFPGEQGNQHRAACKGGREAHWVTSSGDDGVGREPDDVVWQTDEEVADWTPMVVVRPVAESVDDDDHVAAHLTTARDEIARTLGVLRRHGMGSTSGTLSEQADAFLRRLTAGAFPSPALSEMAELTRIGRVFREYGHPWEGAFGPSPAEHLEDVLRGLHTVRKAKEVQDRLIAGAHAEMDRLALERDAFIGRFTALTSPALRDAVTERWPDDPDARDILTFVAHWATASAEPPPQPVDGVPFLVAQELETLRGQARVWISTVADLRRSLSDLRTDNRTFGLAFRSLSRALDDASGATGPVVVAGAEPVMHAVRDRLAKLTGDVREWQARTSDLLDVVREHTGVRPNDDADAARIVSSLLKPMAEAVSANFDLELRVDRAEKAARVVGDMIDAMDTDSRDWGAGARLDTWIYGVLASWWCDEEHTHDDITCVGPPFGTNGRPRGALRAVAERQGLSSDDARRMVERHRAIAAWLSDCGVTPGSRIDPVPAPEDFARCPAVHTSRTSGRVFSNNRFRCALPSGHPKPVDDEHRFEVYPDAEYDVELFRLLSLVDDRTFVVEGYRSVFEVLPSFVRDDRGVLHHRGSEVYDPDRAIVLDALVGGGEPLLGRVTSRRSSVLMPDGSTHQGDLLVLSDAGRAWLDSHRAGGR